VADIDAVAMDICQRDSILGADVTEIDLCGELPVTLAGEWIVVAAESELPPGASLVARVAERDLCLWSKSDGALSVAFGTAPGRPETRINLLRAYGFIWLCSGAPKRPIFLLPEYGAPDGRVVHCGALGVRTSPLRAVENFLDLGHFPYVHTAILGEEPHTEVRDYRVEWRESVDELWALDCVFRQLKAAPGAASAQETGYSYRVVSPFNVILYKSSPPPFSGDDVICLFIQPMAEDRIRAHMLMVLKDATSTMSGMIAFQQMIFGQDKPILENHMPRLLPLTGRSEKPARADAMSMAYRKWLQTKGWTYGVQRTSTSEIPGVGEPMLDAASA
jgi:phenylpropionate dioxygenase-like ring-hydroxylating dioxygenase large terminal subunit